MVLIVTRVPIRDLAGSATPSVPQRDAIGNPLVVVTTYHSIVVTETITRDPSTGLAVSKARTVADAP